MITIKRNEATLIRVAYPSAKASYIDTDVSLDIVVTRPNLDGFITTSPVAVMSKDCFNQTFVASIQLDIDAGEYLIEFSNNGTVILKDNLLILEYVEAVQNQDGTAIMYNNQDIINQIPIPPDGGGTGVVDIGTGEYIPPPIVINPQQK